MFENYLILIIFLDKVMTQWHRGFWVRLIKKTTYFLFISWMKRLSTIRIITARQNEAKKGLNVYAIH